MCPYVRTTSGHRGFHLIICAMSESKDASNKAPLPKRIKIETLLTPNANDRFLALASTEIANSQQSSPLLRKPAPDPSRLLAKSKLLAYTLCVGRLTATGSQSLTAVETLWKRPRYAATVANRPLTPYPVSCGLDWQADRTEPDMSTHSQSLHLLCLSLVSELDWIVHSLSTFHDCYPQELQDLLSRARTSAGHCRTLVSALPKEEGVRSPGSDVHTD